MASILVSSVTTSQATTGTSSALDETAPPLTRVEPDSGVVIRHVHQKRETHRLGGEDRHQRLDVDAYIRVVGTNQPRGTSP